MIKRYIQNLLPSRHLVHAQAHDCGCRCVPDTSDTHFPAQVIHVLHQYIAEIGQTYKREAEKRKSINHLQGMTDSHLRDLGITRLDISKVVRYGKEDS
jgi:uncharacterized protein YjiS (DUF1127 family)